MRLEILNVPSVGSTRLSVVQGLHDIDEGGVRDCLLQLVRAKVAEKAGDVVAGLGTEGQQELRHVYRGDVPF